MLALLMMPDTLRAFGDLRGNCFYDGLDFNGSKATSDNDSLHVFCYGYVDFFSVYTRMRKSYPDYSYPNKNLTFAPYPDAGLINRNAEQPLLFLAVEGMKNNTSVKINFNLLHSFNGFHESFSKNLIFRMPPSFEVRKYAPFGTFAITAGDCTGKTYISPFTLSGQSLVTHPFERLPWDWYPKAFDKYSSVFNSNENHLKVIGLNASQGFLFSGDQVFRHLGVKVFYGRTNFTSTPVQVSQKLPAYVLAGKLSWKYKRHLISFNSYYRQIQSDHSVESLEKNQIVSLEYDGPLGKNSGWVSEIAHNRSSALRLSESSLAAWAGVYWKSRRSNFTIKLNVYFIPYEFVSLDNAVLNSNTNYTISGISNDHLYNLTLFVNPLQSPDVMSNNRIGTILVTGSNKGKFRFSLEQGFSREIHHYHDSITFFHQTNSFTRSRFTPWLQGSGPYQRIGGRYRYTTETITYNTQGSPLYFYSGILRIRYSDFLWGKEYVLLVSPGYSGAATEMLSDDSFNSYYLDVSGFCKVAKKINLLAFIGIQSNTFDWMLPYTLNQRSLVWGVGTDVEIGKTAGFFIRYKKFRHEDKNYSQDYFKGEEITTEVKIFF